MHFRLHVVGINPISSAENQKGINAFQECSIENQKGAIIVQSLWQVYGKKNENKKKKSNLRARRALMLFTDVPLRTRRALSLYKVYGNSALLVLNGTSLNSDNTLLAVKYQRFDQETISSLQIMEKDKSLTQMWLMSL